VYRLIRIPRAAVLNTGPSRARLPGKDWSNGFFRIPSEQVRGTSNFGATSGARMRDRTVLFLSDTVSARGGIFRRRMTQPITVRART